MKISIKNFRIFENEANFEIRPLTILVGPNNSGKSSFTKFLLLLKNGYESLNFEKNQDHKLSTYKNELNKYSKSDELQLKFSMNDIWISQEAEGSLTYIKDHNQRINIKSTTLFNGLIKFDKIDRLGGVKINIRTQEFIDFVKNNIFNVLQEKSLKFKLNFFDLNFSISQKEKIKSKYLQGDIFFVPDNEDFKLFQLYTLSELYYELKQIEPPYFFYDVYVFDSVDKENQNIDNIQTSDMNFVNRFLLFGDEKIDSQLFTKIFNPYIIKDKLEKVLEEKYKGNLNNYEIEIKPSKLNQLLFESTFPLKEDDDPHVFYSKFTEFLFKNIFNDLKILSNNIFIPAKRGSQERFFQKSDFFYETISKYNSEKNDDNVYDIVLFEGETLVNFRKNITKIFDIDGEIIVKEFESLQAVYIKKGDNEENLSDLGLGFSQLIPLILFFHNLSFSLKKYTLIIEEPEANLHPALQSKLADFFTLIIKSYPEINLIIETHSEYFIRKLQYLVANKELSSKDCAINYFNAPNNKMQKVKIIEILNNGMLSDHFGSGFFDEIAELQIKLKNLNRENLN